MERKPVQNTARKYTDETREDRKLRLKACGQWENFVKRRFELQAQGFPQKEASAMADAEFKNFGVE